jgi:hypothetical protein
MINEELLLKFRIAKEEHKEEEIMSGSYDARSLDSIVPPEGATNPCLELRGGDWSGDGYDIPSLVLSYGILKSEEQLQKEIDTRLKIEKDRKEAIKARRLQKKEQEKVLYENLKKKYEKA